MGSPAAGGRGAGTGRPPGRRPPGATRRGGAPPEAIRTTASADSIRSAFRANGRHAAARARDAGHDGAVRPDAPRAAGSGAAADICRGPAGPAGPALCPQRRYRSGSAERRHHAPRLRRPRAEKSLRPTDRPANTTTKEKAPSAAAAPSAPRAAQRATGAGNSGGTARMQAPAKPRPGPSAAQIRSAQAQWGGAIRQSVARAQRYPRGTTARGIVTLRISVSPSGNLAGASVTGSSGTAALDRAALQAARSARLPRAPEALTDASYSFNLPLQFARR